jgi:hypothetical protein
LIPNPTLKVLSSIQEHRVRALLMGVQACVLYGAAEFSRDIDLAILADLRNLVRLRNALYDLRAEVIAVPPLDAKHLRRGHAIHFRCLHPEALRVRIDVMSRMRGMDAFPKLWARRTTLILPDRLSCNLMSLPDLVQAKKTQRDKDWPMLRRLLEAHYFEHRAHPSRDRVAFWLKELRTPELLVEVARSHPRPCRRMVASRPLLAHALSGDVLEIARGLHEEEAAEREKDRQYWSPLRRELEFLRRAQRMR